MATEKRGGPLRWEMTRDENGFRHYKIWHRVAASKGQGIADGPYNVLNTPGLPLPGSLWAFDGDFDPYARCRWDAQVSKDPNVGENDPCELYVVEQDFSTRPLQFCNEFNIENPLLEPQRISGSFVEFLREATHDRHGRPIVNSAWEMLRGAQNEWEESKPIVRVEQNVPLLQLGLINAMNNTVNAYPLWGMPARTIKLTVLPWERKFYGACFAYFTRAFEFRISFERDKRGRLIGWDRELLDEGSKALGGPDSHWSPDTGEWVPSAIPGYSGSPNPNPLNPSHFIRVFDRAGNPMRVILDGNGVPYEPPDVDVTMACGACTAGAPEVWNLTVSIEEPEEGADGDWNPYAPGATLTHSGGCAWSGDGYILSTSGDSWEVTSGASIWRIEQDRFRCMGQNTLRNVTGVGPATVTLIPQLPSESSPGDIRVEKYHEANFLVLGIPLVLI